MKLITQGWRGKIYQYTKEWIRYARKEPRFSYTAWAIEKESVILHHLSQFTLPFLAIFEWRDEKWFTYQWIDGRPLDTIWSTVDEIKHYHYIRQLLQIAYKLDQLGVVHGEMQRPMKNILIKDDDSVMIVDFDRWTLWDYSWKNMKAIGQWVVSLWIITVDELRTVTVKKEITSIYNTLQATIDTAFSKHTHHSPPAYTWSRHAGKVLFYTLLLVSADQRTKYLFYNLWVWSTTKRITPMVNQGSAWSFGIDIGVLISVGIGIMVVIILLWWKRRMTHGIFIWMFAGAVWNMIDRIWLRGVRDFIDLQVWPIFNLADVYLTIALILYLRWVRRLFRQSQAMRLS
jgi:predicted Ser/Thr protein kinase/lipoprotein signal peptidase